MEIGSDRKTRYFDEKGRRLVYETITIGVILVLCMGSAWLVGYTSAIERSCSGYLLGDPWSYRCISQDWVEVCIDAESSVLRRTTEWNSDLAQAINLTLD